MDVESLQLDDSDTKMGRSFIPYMFMVIIVKARKEKAALLGIKDLLKILVLLFPAWDISQGINLTTIGERLMPDLKPMQPLKNVGYDLNLERHLGIKGLKKPSIESPSQMELIMEIGEAIMVESVTRQNTPSLEDTFSRETTMRVGSAVQEIGVVLEEASILKSIILSLSAMIILSY